MDKNIVKNTMLSLEGAALQSAREKYFDYIANARLDRSEPIERDEQAHAEIASDLSEALDDTLHDHTDKLDKLREAFSARVTNSLPPTSGGQGPLKGAGLAGLFEKQYYVHSAKACKPAQIVYHMVAQNWTSRLPAVLFDEMTAFGSQSCLCAHGIAGIPAGSR
jgi:FMN phosphatase YigB (HAD superfamily)